LWAENDFGMRPEVIACVKNFYSPAEFHIMRTPQTVGGIFSC
jgi:hypothetical protein